MKPVFKNSLGHLALAVSVLLGFTSVARAQDPQQSPTPLDEKARQKAEKEAKKAAEQEEKLLRAAAEKERKEAEAAARQRAKNPPRTQDAPSAEAATSTLKPAVPSETPDPELARLQKGEEKARAEAEKARKKEEDRQRAQDAKDAERRRKDEERAEKEAAKARAEEDKAREAAKQNEDRAEREAAKVREREEKARLEALRKEQEESEKNALKNRSKVETAPTETSVAPPKSRDDQAATATPVQEPAVKGSKEEEKRRKELVKQIEKARAERDRLNLDAENAERTAKAARASANEGQRAYEALATGLDVEDITLPSSPAEDAPKKNRFRTKADENASGPGGSANAPDPLRVALDLKKPDPESREKAAFALASMGPDAQPATRALMAALTDPNASVRVAAAQALGRIGFGASAAIAPLSAALTDPDPAVKNAAQAALIAIQGGR